MKINESKMSLIGKARARPDQVKKVLDTLRQHGPVATYQKVSQRLNTLTTLGYSLSGVVEEVGSGVSGLSVGDRVACAGNTHALHAEFNWVPLNLLAKVPEGVPLDAAAFTTIGSIALQGIRQADPKPGEWVAVVGLGLIGQLAVSMLSSFGVRVIGFDLSADRCALAESRGAALTCNPSSDSEVDISRRVADLTDAQGCDHVLIAAGGASNGPVDLAPVIARDRARVTIVGKTGLLLSWNAYYEKEMEVVFSRSYGPGRYDPMYELAGVDYPIGYVRWTEQRNMQHVLDLLSSARLDLSCLISGTYDFSDAVNVFESLNGGSMAGIGFALRYDLGSAATRTISAKNVVAHVTREPTKKRITIGAIGCGNYASSMLFPNILAQDDAELVAVTTMTAASALNAQRKFGFERMSTDVRSVIEDESIDTVLIATRHSSHAQLVVDSLRAGKAVFVEKPLALTVEELDAISTCIETTRNDRLMVGFNRRFSPLFLTLKDLAGDLHGQTIIYRVNAGSLESGSWYSDRDAEGDRFVGEGGHFIDTISWWAGSDPLSVQGFRHSALRDELTVVLRYPAATATVVYATGGNLRFPKERFEAFGAGAAATLDNFTRIEHWSGSGRRSRRAFTIDKGQRNLLAAFLRSVRDGAPMPIPLTSILKTTRATILAASDAKREFAL